MKIQKVEQFIGRVTIVLVFYLIIFLVIDFFSISFLSNKTHLEKNFPVAISRHPKPYVMFQGKPSTDIFNRLGYRGKAPTTPKGKEEFRIFMLGGSTVLYGEPPLPELLEEEFKKNGYDHVKVYNFGVLSSVSRMELVRILLELVDLQPDLNIVYNGGNDILSPFYWDPRPGYPFNFIVYENNPLLESDIRTYPALPLFLYGSNIMRFFMSSYFVKKFVPLRQMQEKVKWLSEEWRDRIAQVYVENLLKAKHVSSLYGAKFMAIYQPLIYYKDNLSEYEHEIFSRQPVKKAMDVAIDIRKKILIKVNVHQSSDDINFYDFSDIFDGSSETIFEDHIHIAQKYKSVIAKRMYEQITRQIDPKDF